MATGWSGRNQATGTQQGGTAATRPTPIATNDPEPQPVGSPEWWAWSRRQMAASGDRIQQQQQTNTQQQQAKPTTDSCEPAGRSESRGATGASQTHLRDNRRRAIRHCRASAPPGEFPAPGGAIPDVGDPFVDQTAEAQYGANKQAAVDEAQLNRITQQTPWGTLEYVYDPTTGETTQTTTLNPEDQARLDQWRASQQATHGRHLQRRS